MTPRHKKCIALLLAFAIICTVAIALFVPFPVRAIIFKEAPLPVSFEQVVDPLFNVDFGIFQLSNFSMRWYNEDDNATYSLFVSNMTALANHGEESLHGNDQALIVFVHVHNLTLTSDPLRWEIYLHNLDMTLELRVDDDNNVSYQAYVPQTTTLFHELTGW